MEVMTYLAAEDRYDSMTYRRCGRSGIDLPAISLGLWNNFGDDKPLEVQRAIVRRAFDLGITHIDLANNYGPPPRRGRAELRQADAPGPAALPRRADHLVQGRLRHVARARTASGARASTCWPASTRAWSRMGLDYVDIFYSHRFDPRTPLEETMGALDTAVRSGRALYVGISSYSADRTKEAVEIMHRLGTPLLIHQPSYSLLNRWIEPDVVEVCDREGLGIIAFSPLGQGMLTDRYLGGIPEDSRAAKDHFLKRDFINEENMARVRGLNEIAQRRGQALAQMALAWVLRDPRVTSALIGASSRRAARDQRGRAGQPGVHRRGARRDRPARRRRRDQHLAAVERRLMPSRLEIMREFVPPSPLVRHLGIELRVLEPDRAELALPFDARLATLADVVHGGAIASLIDTAGMAATWADPDVEPDGVAGATMTLNVEYIAAARGQDLLAVATVVRRGRSLCFTDVLVTEPDGRIVAKGSVVQRFG